MIKPIQNVVDILSKTVFFVVCVEALAAREGTSLQAKRGYRIMSVIKDKTTRTCESDQPRMIEEVICVAKAID